MSRILPAAPRKCPPAAGRFRAANVLLLTVALLAATATGTAAQGRQTGTIRGALLDAQGLVLPGVTVTVRSDAMQGVRTTVTDINGNYRILALPPGEYRVFFELSGFAAIVETATVSLGGDVGVNAVMAPAGVVETVEVVGVVPTPLETTITSSNITADEVYALPTSRQPWRIAELQPGLTDNTPNAGQVTINGAFAYDNIFLVDGVDINDNLFGTANSLFVEDAIQETQVLTSGISAEYGRFSGGVINIITRSGGNDFSGSYRLNMYNPSSWTSLTPFEDEPREGDLGDNLDHEITLGGPLVRDRLWFFYSGLITRQAGNRHVQRDAHPLRHRRNGGPQPVQADRDPRARPHAVGQLPAASVHRHRLDVRLQRRAEHDHRPRKAAGPVRQHLPRRAHQQRVRRGAVLAEAARVPRRGRHVGRHLRLSVPHPHPGAGALQRPVLRRHGSGGPQQPADHRQRDLVPVEPTGGLAQPESRLRALHVDQHRRQLAKLHRVGVPHELRGRPGRQPAARRRRAARARIHAGPADDWPQLAAGPGRQDRHQHDVVLRERRVGAERALLVQPGRARRDGRQRGDRRDHHGRHQRGGAAARRRL